MKHQSTFPRIGSTPEQEAHSAPAIRRSLAEIVAEYVAKAESIAEAVKTFEAAQISQQAIVFILTVRLSPGFNRTARLLSRGRGKERPVPCPLRYHADAALRG